MATRSSTARRSTRTTPRRNTAGNESGLTLTLSDRGILTAPITPPTFDQVLIATQLCERYGRDEAEIDTFLTMLGLA
ncbi:hypothetical protein [Streptosporangium sp. NPDC051022]|uniref:hypothetical protein n=1 Tax=Streptosporangium sp. NPDC051022 TaxID=3155752 RepID=UPI00342C90B3